MVREPYFPPDMRQRVADVLAAQKAFDSPDFKRRLDEIYAQQKQLDPVEFKRQLAHAVAVSKALDPPATAQLEEEIAEELDEPEHPQPPAGSTPSADPFRFRDMTPHELADWMGGLHAEVGSPRWEQARAWYEIKLMEARQSSTPAPVAAPPPSPPVRWYQRGYWHAIIGGAAIIAAIAAVLALFVTD